MAAYFKYNGRRSDEFGIRIHNSLEFGAPRNDITAVPIIGRHGDILIDNERMECIDKPIAFDIVMPRDTIHPGDGSQLAARVQNIVEWLTVKGWHDFEWSMYPGYIYKATILDPYSIADTYRWLGKGVIRVKFHPIKYISPIQERTIKSGDNLLGMGSIPAKPLIKLTMAKPEATVKLNGADWFKLVNVEGTLEIDSELMQITDRFGSASDKLGVMRPLFPVLTLSNNVVTYDVTAITSFRIVPRWAVKAT